MAGVRYFDRFFDVPDAGDVMLCVYGAAHSFQDNLLAPVRYRVRQGSGSPIVPDKARIGWQISIQSRRRHAATEAYQRQKLRLSYCVELGANMLS